MFGLSGRLGIELAIVVAALSAFWGYTVHIEHAQKAKDDAYDARLAEAQRIRNEEVERRAHSIVDAASGDLHVTLVAPPAADAPHLVLHQCTPQARAVRTDAGPGQPSHAESAQPAVVPPAPADVDVGPTLDKRFAEDDALILYFQKYVQACIDAKLCKSQ